MVSVIIPTFNEESVIGRTLDRLGEAGGNFEVLVADGESDDSTCELVAARVPSYPHGLRIVPGPRHRAEQLNRAAGVARGNSLLFLHADIHVPRDAISRIEEALLDPSVVGGNFQIAFTGGGWINSLFTFIYRARRPFGIYYGDSGIFVRRETFRQMGGFKPIPIMDDYEFIRRLERVGKTRCLEPRLLVPDRRWRVEGLLATLVSWVLIQGLYSLGVSPHRLAPRYPPVRESPVSGGFRPQKRGGPAPQSKQELADSCGRHNR